MTKTMTMDFDDDGKAEGHVGTVWKIHYDSEERRAHCSVVIALWEGKHSAGDLPVHVGGDGEQFLSCTRS